MDTAESRFDVRAIVPPDGMLYYTRRVRGRNAWIWYRTTDSEIIVSRLSYSPPIPADEPLDPDDGPSAAE